MAKKKIPYYETEIGKVIEEHFDSRMTPMLFAHIFSKGMENLSKVTDKDLEEIEGCGMFTKDFLYALNFTAREICNKFSYTEISEYFKNYV